MKKSVILILIIVALIFVFVIFFRKNLAERISDWNNSPESEVQQTVEATIGYIGCSNTRETVEGYHRVGGEKMWSYDKRYDSGAVLDWAREAETGNKYWDVFDELLIENPNTKIIWWQLCIRHDEEETSYEHADLILKEIRVRIPGAKIYVSSLADYTDGICEITGTSGLEKAKELVRELDNNGDVFPGPILGPMTSIDTANDGCHLSSPDGKRKLGMQMKEFFDKVEIENSESGGGEEDYSENKEKIEEEGVFFEKIWQERIQAAMIPANCPDVIQETYPALYYKGPLTDTHLHIPAIPDWPAEEESLFEDEAPEGRFGGPQALLGWNIKISEIACTIKQEGTNKNFAFFPVYGGEISSPLLEIWSRTMEEYPEQFTPFIMSSGNDDEPDGFPTVDAETLESMLEIEPELFKGYGEIGLYARENGGSPELSPDSERLKEIYPIVRENNLVVYFHLGEGQKESFEKILDGNLDINFIWHGDQLSTDEIEDILSKHSNAYYGIDAFWGHDRDLFLLFVGKSKEGYMNKLNANFDTVLNYAVSDWKAVIERHPDQVMWGIDRGDAVWNYDADLGRLQVKLARAFIGKLDPSVQERFAYKNAEKIFEER